MLTKQEKSDLNACAARYVKEADNLHGIDLMGLKTMLKAVNNHCRIDFGKLKNFDTFNFFHDMQGMLLYAEIPSGILTDFFVPHCVKSGDAL